MRVNKVTLLILPLLAMICSCDNDKIDLEKYHENNSVEGMTMEKVREIKIAYRNNYTSKRNPESSIDDIKITEFCGEYHKNAYVIMISDIWEVYNTVMYTEIVDGVTFNYTDSHTLDVYYENYFYKLPEAFQMGLLTHIDLVMARGMHDHVDYL